MRISVIVIVAAIAMAGCAHLTIQKNIDALKTIQPGDSQETVLQRLGPPNLRHDITDSRVVFFYQTLAVRSDTPLNEASCTAVAFENGQVIAVGDDPTQRWMDEEADRIFQAEQKRRAKALAEAAQQKADAERQRKIAELEAAVRPIPASNTALNLKIYRQLRDLDPENGRYRQKVATYEKRLAQQKKARKTRLQQTSSEPTPISEESVREARNRKLRKYSGNGIAEMAVHDLGGGSLYVWVRNISQQVITTHPDHFALQDKNGKPIACRISQSLDHVLEPGHISHGKIMFDATSVPNVLIFKNGEAGRIDKFFD